MLGAVSCTEVVSWGILYYAFAVFLGPMGRELRWSKEAMTGAFSLSVLVSGVAAVPAGFWLDRYGPKWLMVGGSALASVLVFAWSRTASLAAFYAIWVGLGISMAAVLYEPAFFIVARWFGKRSNAALTLLTTVGGLASVIFVPLCAWLVESRGWRGALESMAAILLVATLVPHLFFLPPSSELPVLHEAEVVSASVREVVRDRAFWLLTAAFVLTNFAVGAISVHLVPLLEERGYPPAVAAAGMAAVGLASMPGRIIFTLLGGRLPRRMVTASIFGCIAVSFAALAVIPGAWGLWTFVVLFGGGMGAVTPARAALVAEIYGVLRYGSVSSVLSAFLTFARAASPFLASLAYARFAGYGVLLWTLFAMSAAGTFLVAWKPAGTRRVAA